MKSFRTSNEWSGEAANFPERCVAGTSCFVDMSGHGTVWARSQGCGQVILAGSGQSRWRPIWKRVQVHVDRGSITSPQFCWRSIGDDCWTSSYWWRPHSSKSWQKGIQFGLAGSDRWPTCHQRTYGIGVHVPEWRSQVQPCISWKGMGPERSVGALRML